ncbi:MAG TPA: zinc-binding dehydrogenase [Thermoanaerobaculia bacterium]|nr:zinc-binding dehydrogenase [Thermoanaerobaculia bacterium]
MKAIVISRHGGREQLEVTTTKAPPRKERAIVRVRAVALNHLDVWLRRGVPGHVFPLPMIPGSEVSGIIEWLPDGAEGWAVGDEVIVAPGISCALCAACLSGNDQLCLRFGVFGESENGGCAEEIAAPVRNLFRKPPGLSFAEAAAAPLDFLTAWHMLVARAELREGETVLVHAGGSGVGSAAIQIARLWGAKVIATAGSSRKTELAAALGAHHTVNYSEHDFLAEVRTITGRRGVDVVVEHVGADTFDRSLRALARGGRLVTCGATTGGDVRINLNLVFFKLLSILGSTMGSLRELREIMTHLESGKLRPIVDTTLPLEQVAEAHRLIEERLLFGKVVLTVQ